MTRLPARCLVLISLLLAACTTEPTTGPMGVSDRTQSLKTSATVAPWPDELQDARILLLAYGDDDESHLFKSSAQGALFDRSKSPFQEGEHGAHDLVIVTEMTLTEDDDAIRGVATASLMSKKHVQGPDRIFVDVKVTAEEPPRDSSRAMLAGMLGNRVANALLRRIQRGKLHPELPSPETSRRKKRPRDPYTATILNLEDIALGSLRLPGEGLAPHTDPVDAIDFSIRPPEGWMIRYVDDVLVLSNPLKDDTPFRARICIASTEAPDSYEDKHRPTKMLVHILGKLGTRFLEHGPRSPLRRGGVHWEHLTRTKSFGLKIHSYRRVIIQRGRAYFVFAYAGDATELSRLQSTFEACGRSLVPKG